MVLHGARDETSGILDALAALASPHVSRVVVTRNLPPRGAADAPPAPAYPFELVVLVNEAPQGFAANHNRAFAHCTTSWFAVVNPDVGFPWGDPFPALLAAAVRTERPGALAPLLVDPRRKRAAPLRGMVTPWEILRHRLPGASPPADVFWLPGAFLLLAESAFRAVGGFDEGYRLYCEDVDLGLRLKRDGWSLVRVEDARVLHRGRRSSHYRPGYARLHLQSLIRLNRRWRGRALPSRGTPR